MHRVYNVVKYSFPLQIVSLEYQPRAVHIKGHNVDNRWVVTLDSQYSVNRLSGSQLTFGSKVVTVRRYDDVLGLEFKQFTRRSNFMKMFGQKWFPLFCSLRLIIFAKENIISIQLCWYANWCYFSVWKYIYSL